jgi:RNA recognition motif-containing protein
VEVKRARRTGRSLGNAVVEFEDATSVYTAIGQLNNQDLKGRTVLVREFFV